MRVYKWLYPQKPNSEQVNKLSKAINLRKPLTRLLLQRGIYTFEEAKTFFRPNRNHLQEPFLMKDMLKAVKRLEIAITNQEKVMIYGDYDVDGTTSVSLVYNFLKPYVKSLFYHIPDRYTEGYGLSQIGIDKAKKLGCSLMITLDCGIKANDKVAYANTKNIDSIICDHHLPPKKLPDAFAILNPKQTDCSYPYKELTGCGIGFKFMHAFAKKQKIDQSKLFKMIDLVAVSTACDLVPIDDENRAIVSLGLKQLEKTTSLGLKTLIDSQNMKKTDIQVQDLVFGIGPRINAAGRISHAHEAVSLLISEDKNFCQAQSKKINSHNSNRKTIDKQTAQEALELIRTTCPDTYTTVLYQSHWHKGVIGIVASRCIEHYYRPTIILTQSKDYIVGSARSIEGLNIYEALEYCQDSLEQFGGHYFAAGLKLKAKNLEVFKAQFEAYTRKKLTIEHLTPNIKIDTSLKLDDITSNFYKTLMQMSPFGPKNMFPIFESKNIHLIGRIAVLKEKHLKFRIGQSKQRNTFTVLGFNMVDYKTIIESGTPFSICYQIKENTYNAYKPELQFYLKDLVSD